MKSVPLKQREAVTVFSDEDHAPGVSVFKESEAASLCRYCAHYVVNPFMQYCTLHRREVEATDSCGAFVPVEDSSENKNTAAGR